MARELVRVLLEKGLTLSVAESLTGGKLASRIVEVPGASGTFQGGVVAYAAAAKNSVLGVSGELLRTVGTVDPRVACEMAQGAQTLFSSDLALATTGVAGPGPAEGQPQGTVYIALAFGKSVTAHRFQFRGDRSEVREETVRTALRIALAKLAADD